MEKPSRRNLFDDESDEEESKFKPKAEELKYEPVEEPIAQANEQEEEYKPPQEEEE